MDENLPETPKPALLIEFAGPGSCLFSVKVDGQVLPMQLLAVAEYIRVLAQADILEARSMQRIRVPENPQQILKASR